jgi:hypothetical protein
VADSTLFASYSLDAVAGQTYEKSFTFGTVDSLRIFTPTDVSGGTYTAVIKSTPTGTAVATFTIDSTNAATGILIIKLTAAATAGLNATDNLRTGLLYELKWTTAGSVVKPLMRGAFNVYPAVA